ncbi:hypothetical protein ES703_17820 [subsurface metagenome]
MRELIKEELEEVRGLEKLTIDELKEKKKKLLKECKSYNEKVRVARGRLEMAIRARGLIGIYEEYGFEGLYAEIRKYFFPDDEKESVSEDDIPF